MATATRSRSTTSRSRPRPIRSSTSRTTSSSTSSTRSPTRPCAFDAVRPHAKILVAEKISTHEENKFLHGLGFDLFQGHYLELPIVERRERLPHDRSTLVRLLAKLYDAKSNYKDIEKLLAAEVGLTMRLFKLAGSTANARGAPVGSIAQAVARLGTQQFAGLVLLLVAPGCEDKPLELVKKALVRAKMCEALAKVARVPSDELFTAGLFTLLDAVLDQPLDVIIAQLPVTDLIRDIVMGKPVGDCSRIVTAARAQDRGDFATITRPVPGAAVFVAWYEACPLDRLAGPRSIRIDASRASAGRVSRYTASDVTSHSSVVIALLAPPSSRSRSSAHRPGLGPRLLAAGLVIALRIPDLHGARSRSCTSPDSGRAVPVCDRPRDSPRHLWACGATSYGLGTAQIAVSSLALIGAGSCSLLHRDRDHRRAGFVLTSTAM